MAGCIWRGVVGPFGGLSAVCRRSAGELVVVCARSELVELVADAFP